MTIKHIISVTLAALALISAVRAAPSLVYEGTAGPGKGKHIVFLSGDHEYRSEETLPALARVLAKHHGFKCTVLFTTDAKSGAIVPGNSNSPGLEALATADLAVVYLRFQDFPAEQMKHVVAYLERGGPVIGLRTATHAFRIPASGEFKKYSWDYKGDDYVGGFGHQVLGQSWVGHYGKNHQQSTRIEIVPAASAHPILRGVKDVWVQAGGYVGKPTDGEILTMAQPLNGMTPASPPDATKTPQPSEWTRTYRSASGKTGRVFTSLYGASEDLLNEGYRRLLVNATFWAVGLEAAIKPDLNVALVGPYRPSTFGNNRYIAAVKPSAYAGFESPIPAPGSPPPPPANAKAKAKQTANTKAEAAPTPAPAPAPAQATPPAPTSEGAEKQPTKKQARTKQPAKKVDAPHSMKAEPATATARRPQNVAPPSKGERVVLIGNGLAERDVYYSRIETELALRYPEHALFFRNMGHVGDTPGFRPHPSRASQWAFPGAEKFHPDLNVHKGQGFFPTPDQWLTHLKADTIVAFFGYNESFGGPAKVANFEGELDAWVRHTLGQAYNGEAAPRVVLVSPIAFENQSAQRDLPDGVKENANLALYTKAIAAVAKKHGLTFIDLFTPTQALYRQARTPLTTGGFIPNDEGYQHVAKLLATGIYGEQARVSKADPALVHAAVKQKDYFWNNDYHIVNGVHAYGRRYAPYGPQNYPDEVKKTREMTALRDTAIHAIASGKKSDLAVEDTWTHPLPPVPTNYQPSVKNGSESYLAPEDGVASLTVPEGYKVELFASEKQFPNLANPMQLSFDNRGRLWVAVMPAYPAYRPGDALPNDKILIYEDTDGDGKADKETVFADKLYLPIGFEFAPEGVYVSQEPNLVLMRDTDGDDRADRTEIILGGFDTHDTHHAISAFTADPSGAIMMCEGIFLHSNVETPYGPVRCVDGGFFRYSPQRGMLERTIQMNIPNPWGYAFDRWGQDFFLFTSGTAMNWALPMQVKPTFGSKTPATIDLIPAAEKVRPTSGLEIVSSRHFPDEVQGDIILANAIGFLGIKQHQIEDDGTGWKTTFRQNLLKSSDGNFRPVDLEFAPDGSLYVIDWHNTLIGHMQHNARDPLRDHNHGRIYRITYPSRPLVKPASIAGAPLATLLENLKEPENRTRYRTRREIRSHPVATVLPAVKKWAAKQTDTHAKLEALWVTWGMNAVDEPLLRELLASSDFHARAAAVRVLRYNTHRIADHAALLEKAAADEHGRVRLEATVAASWLTDIDAAKKIVGVAAQQPLDRWDKDVVKTASNRLHGVTEVEKPEFTQSPAPAYLDSASRERFIAGQQIYTRDGHCVTCHQADGKGLDPAFPSLEKSPWVAEDKERLIKLTLYGLMGPLEVNGKTYDGQVPMTPFGGMLNDEEIAAVLTYVRNSFGNEAGPVHPEEVQKVRAANPGRMKLYTTEELLKEHPIK
ncbi:MAG: ThuA domain-containing protein [Opitutaceae bacterium]|nr:ThuA domain-containing protein [Opitutaceae bacterium]